jgi:hypothetical protein
MHNGLLPNGKPMSFSRVMNTIMSASCAMGLYISSMGWAGSGLTNLGGLLKEVPSAITRRMALDA